MSKKLKNPSNSFSKISQVILDEYDFSIERKYPIKRINIWFGGLTSKKLLELKAISNQLNAFYKNNNIPYDKVSRYVKIMNRIKTNPKGYGVSSEAEKFLLFMFSVDPTFEAAKIHGECNKIEETKEKMQNYFGI